MALGDGEFQKPRRTSGSGKLVSASRDLRQPTCGTMTSSNFDPANSDIFDASVEKRQIWSALERRGEKTRRSQFLPCLKRSWRDGNSGQYQPTPWRRSAAVSAIEFMHCDRCSLFLHLRLRGANEGIPANRIPAVHLHHSDICS